MKLTESRDSAPREPRRNSSDRARQRPEVPAGRGQRSDNERPIWQQRVQRARKPDAERSPLIPQEITPEDLDFSVRVQLKTLTAENAEMTARHLAMVNLLIDSDPELAHRHAKAAASRAGRLAVVHETVGLTAYSVGDYQMALRELLTHRRLTASNDQLPIIVDSERGMGRPERALEVARGVDRASLAVGVRINLAIALSGARLDLGDNQRALLELEIPELVGEQIFPQSPLLFRCYAEVLSDLGQDNSKWLQKAERAEVALATAGEEVFELIEEISIPTSKEIDDSKLQAARPYGARPARRDGVGASSGGFSRKSVDRKHFSERKPRGGSSDRPQRGGKPDRGSGR